MGEKKKKTFSNKNHTKTQSHTGNIPSSNNEVIEPKFIYLSYTTRKLKNIYERKEESREKGQFLFVVCVCVRVCLQSSRHTHGKRKMNKTNQSKNKRKVPKIDEGHL